MASACDIVYDTSSSSCKLKPPVSTELMASKLVIGGGRFGFHFVHRIHRSRDNAALSDWSTGCNSPFDSDGPRSGS